jgi:hypothetical protein
VSSILAGISLTRGASLILKTAICSRPGPDGDVVSSDHVGFVADPVERWAKSGKPRRMSSEAMELSLDLPVQAPWTRIVLSLQRALLEANMQPAPLCTSILMR